MSYSTTEGRLSAGQWLDRLDNIAALDVMLDRCGAAAAVSTLFVMFSGLSVTFDAWQRASASRLSSKRSPTGNGPAQINSKSVSSCESFSCTTFI